MKKISKIILILCLVLMTSLAVIACGESNDGIKFKSVEGYSSASVDTKTKSISLSTPYATTTLSLTAIKFNVAVSIKAYSDSARLSEVTSLTLLVGDNTYYLVISAAEKSENWKITITRASSGKQVESILVTEFETVYEIGDTFAGGKMTVTYDDQTVTNPDITLDMLSGFDTSTAGSKEVTISYEGKSVKITISVLGELAPTELEFDEIEDEISEIFKLIYIMAYGESIEADDLLEELFAGNQELMDEQYAIVHEFLQDLSFTSSEVSKLADLSMDISCIAEDLVAAIGDYDGEGDLITASIVTDIVSAYNEFKTIFTPIRAAKLVPLIMGMIDSDEEIDSIFDFDEAITLADALGLTDVKAGLQLQKDASNNSAFAGDLSFMEILTEERNVVEYFSDLYRTLDVFLSKNPTDIVRVINLVATLANEDSAESFMEAPDFTELTFVLNLMGDIMLELESINSLSASIYDSIFNAAYSSMIPGFDTLDIDSLTTSSYLFAGNLLKSIDAVTLEKMYDLVNDLVDFDVDDDEPLTPTEQAEYDEMTAQLIVYGVKLLQKSFAAMTTAQKLAFYADLTSLLNLSFDSIPNIQETFTTVLNVASFDPNNLTEAQIEEALGLAELINDFVLPLDYSTNLGNEPIFMAKSSTLAQLRTLLTNSNSYIEIYSEEKNDWYYIDDFATATITGFNAATTGLRKLKISTKIDGRDFSLELPYYIYDNASRSEFELLTRPSYYYSASTPSFELNAENYNSTVNVYYDIFLYNTVYNFEVNLYGGEYVDIIGIDTTSVGTKMGFVKIDLAGYNADNSGPADSFDDFYLPVSYNVYDSANPVVTNVRVQNYYSYYQQGSEPQEYGFIVVEYNYGKEDSVYIHITQDMVTGFDSSIVGVRNYTVTFEHDGETYTLDVRYEIISEADGWNIGWVSSSTPNVFFVGDNVDIYEIPLYVSFRNNDNNGLYTLNQLIDISNQYGRILSFNIDGAIDTTQRNSDVMVIYMGIQNEKDYRVEIVIHYYTVAPEDLDYIDRHFFAISFTELPDESNILAQIGDNTCEITFNGYPWMQLTINELFAMPQYDCTFEFDGYFLYLYIYHNSELCASTLVGELI